MNAGQTCPTGCTFQLVSWSAAESRLRAVRTEVFIQEQRIPESLEWDDADAVAVHALACVTSGQPVGTGRLLIHGQQAQIGRMAVLPAWRRQGVGGGILRILLEEAARRGACRVILHAQTVAVPFYAHFGFVCEGKEFLEVDIPHYCMTRELP